MADSKGRSPKRKSRPSKAAPKAIRRYRSRGVDVEIREAPTTVELFLDGHPVWVTKDGDEYHSQLANQFMAFPTIDDVVATLLANEGRTWTLHGHVCDERCTAHGHHTDAGPGSPGIPAHDHSTHDHHDEGGGG